MKIAFTKICSLLAFATLCTSSFSFGQDTGQEVKHHSKKVYLSTGMDGYILSSTMVQKTGSDNKLSTPRFSGFFHIGIHLNYDFSKSSGIYAGLNIKNIGFIEKYSNPDSTVKRRVYTIGVPLGLKFGNIKEGNYFLIGGGVDFPFNYKEKGFVKRSDKTKFNEWFSDRTATVMPYVFVGAHFRPLFSVKLQYYPGNFLNKDFAYTSGPATVIVQPYSNYEKTNLILLTFGLDMTFRPRN
jgi:hypothetical protein